MTATLPFPTRYLAALGVALLLAAGLLVVRPLLTSSDKSTATTAVPAKTAPTTTGHSATTKPQIVLLPGLPRPVAAKLRHSNVAVVTLYVGTSSSDREAVAVARKGARATGAGFVAMNVLDETKAREAHELAGTTTTPVVLVVRRPGKVVSRFEGRVDSAIVEQAAHNAGARGR